MLKMLLTTIIDQSSKFAGNIIGIIIQSIALVVFSMITLGLLCAFLIVLLRQWLPLLWACLIVLGIAVLILIILCCCRSLFAKPIATRLRRLFEDL